MLNMQMKYIICFMFVVIHVGLSAITKCSPEDAQRKVHRDCVVDPQPRALWCGKTNFTRVPHPEDVTAEFPSHKMEILYMRRSCVDNLESIKKYDCLQRIVLSDNMIRNITRGALDNATKLIRLDISLNLISYIDADSFSELTQLISLNLMHNEITELATAVFTNLTNLKRLHLDWNKLTTLDPKWFGDSTKLQILRLGHNNINTWFESRPNQFEELLELNLDGNRLIDLKPEYFINMPALECISLRSNRIFKVNEGTFDAAPELTSVDLRNNMLQNLPKNLFFKNCNLRTLLLSGNNLITLHPDWFLNLIRNNHFPKKDMTSSALSVNDWTCDCRMMKYWKFLKDLKQDGLYGSIRMHELLDVKCKVPTGLYGKSLTGLTDTQIMKYNKCGDEDNSTNDQQPSFNVTGNCKRRVPKILPQTVENVTMHTASLHPVTYAFIGVVASLITCVAVIIFRMGLSNKHEKDVARRDEVIERRTHANAEGQTATNAPSPMDASNTPPPQDPEDESPYEVPISMAAPPRVVECYININLNTEVGVPRERQRTEGMQGYFNQQQLTSRT